MGLDACGCHDLNFWNAFQLVFWAHITEKMEKRKEMTGKKPTNSKHFI